MEYLGSRTDPSSDESRLYPRGNSRCTKCLDETDPKTLLDNDLLCVVCRTLRDDDPRQFYNVMSHDEIQEDAINQEERSCHRHRSRTRR